MFLRVISTGSKQGNCYSLHSETETLLLDCGCDFNKILKGLEYKTSNVVGCLLSHGHGDHTKAFLDLVKYGIPVYTNDETADYFETATGERMIGRPERIPFYIGGFKVTPFYVPHTTRDKDTGMIISCPNFGYLVEHEEMGKLLYATDMQIIARANGTGTLTDDYGNSIVWNMDNYPYIGHETNGMKLGIPSVLDFRKMHINHMLIECNYSLKNIYEIEEGKRRHVIRGHHSLEVCKGFIERNKTPSLRNVILCHLSSENADEEEFSREVKEVTGRFVTVNVAKSGLAVEANELPF